MSNFGEKLFQAFANQARTQYSDQNIKNIRLRTPLAGWSSEMKVSVFKIFEKYRIDFLKEHALNLLGTAGGGGKINYERCYLALIGSALPEIFFANQREWSYAVFKYYLETEYFLSNKGSYE